MIRPPARVRRTARALEWLTGYRSSITRAPRQGFRITVRVPPDLDEALTEAVLTVLGQGLRYGHSYTATREIVWTEVSHRPVAVDFRRQAGRVHGGSARRGRGRRRTVW
ncbi:hypothetical protein [Kitasatospora sp. GP82]|uniref:hypothetical protein n=1 Tax=Kitasatospora sp. GP82 TaxID=3035089 RepID=UPI002475E1DF|nr:hypothetical protein [Kitasatospora sp. GP82]MDH6128743.1 type VI protein secretion system component VasK [Kitasatospora sp. GP82]